jgi:hypothetical protein
MKPKSPAVIYRACEISSPGKIRRFPIADCSYQQFPLDRFHGGGSARNDDPSFLNISREYFRSEARRNFLAEGIVFLVIVAILAATFISGALIIIRFLELLEA